MLHSLVHQILRMDLADPAPQVTGAEAEGGVSPLIAVPIMVMGTAIRSGKRPLLIHRMMMIRTATPHRLPPTRLTMMRKRITKKMIRRAETPIVEHSCNYKKT